MALAQSPKLITDGLVLFYDAGNTHKSFAGEPASNIANTAGGVQDWTHSNLTASVTLTTLETDYKYQLVSTTGGSGRFLFNLSNLTNNLTYNLSFKYRIVTSSAASPSFTMNDWCDTAITKSTTVYPTYTYETAYGVRATYDSTYRFMDYTISANTTLEMWDFQLEQRAYATPYVQASRANTQVFLDPLKTGITITANSLTYATDGTFDFNGTSDYMSTTTTPAFANADQFSLECVIKPDSATTDMRFITPTGLGIDRWLGITTGGKLLLQLTQASDTGNRGFQSSTSVSTSAYQHWIVTVNGTDINFYLNGELDSNQTDTSGFAVGQWGGYSWYIGQRSNSTFWYGGELPLVKAYDGVLTSAQAAQSFHSIRGRYGI